MGCEKTRVSGETGKKPLPGFVLFGTTSKSPRNVELPNDTPELGHMPVLTWIPTLGPHTMAGTVPALASVSPGDPTRERPAGLAHDIGKSRCLEGHRTEGLRDHRQLAGSLSRLAWGFSTMATHHPNQQGWKSSSQMGAPSFVSWSWKGHPINFARFSYLQAGPLFSPHLRRGITQGEDTRR